MRLIVRGTNEAASQWLADLIIQRINDFKPTAQKPFVLGLPTGSSPEVVYKYLAKACSERRVSFLNVVTFNMDEYVGIPRDHEQSYHTFMFKHLFSKVDINPNNVNILNGEANDLEQECRNYEDKIAKAGGIDLFLGGVGPDGHIAFNEPGSSLKSRTGVRILASSTINANSRFFGGDLSKVPKKALSVGVDTIMQAREVVVIASGSGKARAVKAGVEGPINHLWTISALQAHPNWTLVVDEDATSDLMVKTVKYFKDIEANDARSDSRASKL